jgi:sigma-B regulation protein RsbU (phosphoserine phosphatase)
LGAAVEATGARRGWLVAAGEELVVVAHRGDDTGNVLGGRGLRNSGWAGWVIERQRPVALAPAADDPRFSDDLVLATGGRPGSLVCFPCPYESRIVGALQLVDKAGGALFSVDDVQLIGMIAEIAGAALAEADGRSPEVAPSPQVLGTQLEVMAARNPGRYAAIAEVVSDLLNRS